MCWVQSVRAKLQDELDAGEEEGEPKGRTQGKVRWADDG
jgi:hypothetical protein